MADGATVRHFVSCMCRWTFRRVNTAMNGRKASFLANGELCSVGSEAATISCQLELYAAMTAKDRGPA